MASREFDIIHFHTDLIHFALARHLERPHLTTVHGRLDIPDLLACYESASDLPLVSISHAQRTPLPHAAWVATVSSMPSHTMAWSPSS